MSKLLETTALVAKRINPRLKVTAIIICLYESSAKLSHEVIGDLEAFLERSRGTAAPWAAARVQRTRIRRNIKLAECPSHGTPIFAYAPTCPGALDYLDLAREVLGQPVAAAA